MKIIDQKIKDFIKQEQDVSKKMKNLIISCIEESFLIPENIKQNETYHVWSLYPGCTLTFKGLDEILKIEKEILDYGEGEIIEYSIYGKGGIIVRSGITEQILKDKLLNSFITRDCNSIIAQEIINYLYSGKAISTYNHISWKEAKENK